VRPVDGLPVQLHVGARAGAKHDVPAARPQQRQRRGDERSGDRVDDGRGPYAGCLVAERGGVADDDPDSPRLADGASLLGRADLASDLGAERGGQARDHEADATRATQHEHAVGCRDRSQLHHRVPRRQARDARLGGLLGVDAAAGRAPPGGVRQPAATRSRYASHPAPNRPPGRAGRPPPPPPRHRASSAAGRRG